MFKAKKTAIQINELLASICVLIDRGRQILEEDEDDSAFYSRRMAKVMAIEVGEILNEIYSEHPELEPTLKEDLEE